MHDVEIFQDETGSYTNAVRFGCLCLFLVAFFGIVFWSSLIGFAYWAVIKLSGG